MVKENTYPVVREVSHVVRKAPTVNYHLLRACNYSCGFCFAPFPDIPGKLELSQEKSLERVVDVLCLGLVSARLTSPVESLPCALGFLN